MIIAIDFDGTLVSQERDYDDVTSPLLMLPGALAALRAFVAEFPKSPLKDYAQVEIANAEKAKKTGERKK